MKVVVLALVLVVVACGEPVAQSSLASSTTVAVEELAVATTTAPCLAPPVFQADPSFGRVGQVGLGSVWATEWASIEVGLEVPTGEQVDSISLGAIDAEATIQDVPGGLVGVVALSSGPCESFTVRSTSDTPGAAADALLGFLQTLRPIDGLADHLAELERADEPATCPAGPATPVGPGTVHVMLLCVSSFPVYPVLRQVPEDGDPVEYALVALVEGPTDAERAAGLTGAFDGIDPRPGVRIERDSGVLIIGFEHDGEPWSPLGSVVGSSFQIKAFMDAILATAFQFGGVEAVVLDTCISEVGCGYRTSRVEFEESQAADFGVELSEGCGLAGYWSDMECRAMAD